MSTSLESHTLLPTSSREDRETYNRFVDASLQGILYCKTWWLEMAAQGRWKVLLVKNGSDIRAAWPIVFSERGKSVITPPLTQKLGILYSPATSQKYAEALSEEHRLAQQLLQSFPMEYELAQAFHERFRSWLPLYWAGFQQTTRYTYVLEDLSDPQAIWDGMRPRVRTPIRNAEKNSIVAEETNDLELLYEVNERSFIRQGKKCPYPLSVLARLVSACNEHAGARMLLAKDSQGRIHACDLMIYDDRCAISIVQGADPELRKSGAQALLDWRSIEFASTVSQKFDFEGSMLEAVEPYNRAFGAVQQPYSFIYGRTRREATTPVSRLRRKTAQLGRRIADLIEQ